MANKENPSLQQEEKFEVSSLQSSEVFGAPGGIQVPWFDPRVLGEVVHHLHPKTDSPLHSLLASLPAQSEQCSHQ